MHPHNSRNSNEESKIICACQYTSMTNMGTRFNMIDKFHQFLLRIPPALKRRLRKYRNKLSTSLTSSNTESPTKSSEILKPGDLVRISTYEQIRLTLNEKGYCKGLSFQDPMQKYCGNKYEVFKIPKYILDEGGKKINRGKDLVILKNLTCNGVGTVLEEGCNRCCLHYWKTDWLEKIS